MKNNIFFAIAFLCLWATTYSQEFQGKAYYESKTTIDANFGGREIPEARRKQIMERMKNAFEKTFILTFDRTSSFYVEDEQLEAPSASGGRGGGFFRMMSSDAGKHYKNIMDVNYTKQVEMFGKLFLIKDDLEKLEWQMGSETKKIGNYTCYMATVTKQIDTSTSGGFRRMFRGRRGNGENTEKIEVPSERTITAWYTLDIPISQGPGEYWGLPGLILEVNDDRTTLICTKIVMNAQDRITVEPPKKGKEVSQKEYDGIRAEKIKEMRENFRRGDGPGGRGRRIN